ncbi:hypothetical protein CZ674_04665 [Agrococcus casei LMG 22410]|uniref:Uncharacterized protein n=1 Tax=Agrococcus casei LMG 22410 TaxID=1255656 RepID=A0A1R4FIK5_9MICO|nr:hypothetical protein CZ674_04665 [Agrococcus casei LMG 22410]
MPKKTSPHDALANAPLDQLAAAHAASVAVEQSAKTAALERNRLLLAVVDAGVRPATIARHLGVERQRIHTLIQRARRTG